MFIFCVDRMNSKRKVERNLGHVATDKFYGNVILNLSVTNQI